ncbi:hypothetical protein ONQ62_25945, partial [Salmonella enterica subsp. enterica serovar Virginia]|nr:hypothetical protein [Salmonella enterica subsp. enterica serovar Virginia]
ARRFSDAMQEIAAWLQAQRALSTWQDPSIAASKLELKALEAHLKNREVPFLRRQIGMIFQDHHLLMDRTVYDNVAIPLIIAGAS